MGEHEAVPRAAGLVVFHFDAGLIGKMPPVMVLLIGCHCDRWSVVHWRCGDQKSSWLPNKNGGKKNGQNPKLRNTTNS